MKNRSQITAQLVFTFFLFITLSMTALAQDMRCENFKEGNFAYVEEGNKDWKVERFGAYQFEHSEKYDVLFVASLEWIDECSYLLQYVSISNSDYFDSYGKLLHCEVIPIGGNKYDVVVDDEGVKRTYTMAKLPNGDVTEANDNIHFEGR